MNRRLIEEKWALYRRMVLEPAGLNPAEMTIARTAFFIGASALMGMIFECNDPDALVRSIRAEVAAVDERIAAGGLP